MKTAMVFGAAGGIGQALVSVFKEAGLKVIGVARESDALLGKVDHVIEANLSSIQEVKRMALEAAQLIDEIDLWVYAVGDILSVKAGDITSLDWQRILDANLTGAHYTLSTSLPLLSANAHLFFIGAHVDRLIIPGLAAYAASKAALEAYTAVLEKELRGRKVCLVRPAAVATPFWRKVPFKIPDGAIQPQDVARRILTAYEQGLSGLLDL